MVIQHANQPEIREAYFRNRRDFHHRGNNSLNTITPNGELALSILMSPRSMSYELTLKVFSSDCWQVVAVYVISSPAYLPSMGTRALPRWRCMVQLRLILKSILTAADMRPSILEIV